MRVVSRNMGCGFAGHGYRATHNEAWTFLEGTGGRDAAARRCVCRVQARVRADAHGEPDGHRDLLHDWRPPQSEALSRGETWPARTTRPKVSTFSC